MYYFIATYYNMDTDNETQRTVKVEGQFFKSEKDVYCYAMGKAFDATAQNECFVAIELLSC